MSRMEAHTPVLLEECMEGLALKAGGIYVDATYGSGGHTRELLRRLQGGRVIAFDQDEDTGRYKIADDRLTLVHQNFRYLRRMLRYLNVVVVDGVLADLGVSSMQLSDAQRGFSYRWNGPLDLRMSRQTPLTAAALLAQSTEEQLHAVFSRYGEVRNARTLARAIVRRRQHRPIQSVADFMEILRRCVRGNPHRYYAQAFQALRIAVNDELEALKEFLLQTLEVLRSGGRLVVISYHSLEDRIVKRFMHTGEVDIVSDKSGKEQRPFRLITRRVVVPSAGERANNPRARSARLRIAEKR
ncbi:MAG: 16S rRNA (cytosine(1402)-N(4))-methyltransferase RsmH [Chitinophagales bacterium]|nr:16S rRNA (cytosine(1402)-N(4))-methyltransferase RsmH [Chitinophagales bacterium]MDW8428747.1 16S rRNA (cytosine(1402)-N(4))-methyltransferase RsmH [Chitinophagales bacterium]